MEGKTTNCRCWHAMGWKWDKPLDDGDGDFLLRAEDGEEWRSMVTDFCIRQCTWWWWWWRWKCLLGLFKNKQSRFLLCALILYPIARHKDRVNRIGRWKCCGKRPNCYFCLVGVFCCFFHDVEKTCHPLSSLIFPKNIKWFPCLNIIGVSSLAFINLCKKENVSSFNMFLTCQACYC